VLYTGGSDSERLKILRPHIASEFVERSKQVGANHPKFFMAVSQGLE